MTELSLLLSQPDLKRAGIVLFLVLGNWLCASLVALSQGTFDFKKAPEFFTRTFLPFFGGFILLEAGLHILAPSVIIDAFKEAPLDPNVANVFDASTLWLVFGTVLMALGKSFVSNLSALLGVIVGGAQKLAKANTPQQPPAA